MYLYQLCTASFFAINLAEASHSHKQIHMILAQSSKIVLSERCVPCGAALACSCPTRDAMMRGSQYTIEFLTSASNSATIPRYLHSFLAESFCFHCLAINNVKISLS